MNTIKPSQNTSFLKALFSLRMFVVLLSGFSSGLPLLLTGSTLQAWMKESGIDLATIGLFSLVGLPYTLKFLWSPLMDRYTIIRKLGRRRSWMLVTQIALALAIIALGSSPLTATPWVIAIFSILITFFSASQDIVLDAYRREVLEDNELGLGSSLFINGYRMGMLASGAGALLLADQISWQFTYYIMASVLVVGIVATIIAPNIDEKNLAPRSLKEAVVEPFFDFFRRDSALIFLLFILLYKIGDSMASAMTTPFILELGFTKTEFAAIAKSFGLFATLFGGFLGGAMLFRLGISKSLWIFGILQAVSTFGFSWLSFQGNNLSALTIVIALENLASGMGTSAYAAFMAKLTNKQFTATQYALLSSLMGVPRVLASAPTGYLAQSVGWPVFFTACTLMAIPGLLLLVKVAPWREN